MASSSQSGIQQSDAKPGQKVAAESTPPISEPISEVQTFGRAGAGGSLHRVDRRPVAMAIVGHTADPTERQMTADYWRQKEDAKFEDAFAKLEC